MRLLIGEFRFMRLAATLAAVVALAACGGSSAPSAPSGNGSPIKIGMLAELSGAGVFYGSMGSGAAIIFEQKLNASGGIDGHPVQIIQLDAPSVQAQAAAVQQLHSQGVNIYVDAGSSAEVLAAAGQAERLGMVTVVANASADTIHQQGYQYLVQLPTTETFTDPGLELIKNDAPALLGKPISNITVAMVYSNDTYGSSNAANQKAQLQAMGAKIVLQESYDRNATDMSGVVLAMRNANPDIVLQSSFIADTTLIWKTAKGLNFMPKLVISGSEVASADFLKAFSEAAVEGYAAYSYALPTPRVPSSIDFDNAWVAAYGQHIPAGQPVGDYAAFQTAADIIKAAGDSTDPNKMIAAAQKLNKPAGTYVDDAGFKLNSLGYNELYTGFAYQWQKGVLQTLWPVAAATAKFEGPMAPWSQRG